MSPVVWSQSSALCFFHLIALLDYVGQTITMLSQLLQIMATKNCFYLNIYNTAETLISVYLHSAE